MASAHKAVAISLRGLRDSPVAQRSAPAILMIARGSGAIHRMTSRRLPMQIELLHHVANLPGLLVRYVTVGF